MRHLEDWLEKKPYGKPFITRLYRQSMYHSPNKTSEQDFSPVEASLSCIEHTLKHTSQWLQEDTFGREKKAKPCPYSSQGSWDPSVPTKHLPESWPEGSSEAAFKSKQLSVKALCISTL